MDILKNFKKRNKDDLKSLLQVIVVIGGVYTFGAGVEYFLKIPILTTVLVLGAIVVLIYIVNFITATKDYIVNFFRFESRVKKLEKEVEKLKKKGGRK